MKFQWPFKRESVVAPRKSRLVKAYNAAATKAIFGDFKASMMSADSELMNVLPILRGRARALARNSAVAKRYIQLMQDNIVGSAGFTFRSRAKNLNGKLDDRANNDLEKAWVVWTKTPTRLPSYPFRQVTNTIVAAYCTDGEVFIQKKVGKQYTHGFSIRVIEADMVDESMNTLAMNGNRVIMGVEIDADDVPVAYHMYVNHPGDFRSFAGNTMRIRVPASEIIHVFKRARPGQTRGEPPMCAILTTVQMLDGYREAEVTNRRIASAMMGFFTTPAAEKNDITALADTEDADTGTLEMDVEPGTFKSLPPGMILDQFEPKTSPTEYASFEKQMHRDISMGLGPSYNSMAMDLEGVSYSSIRQGALEDRDFYRSMQQFFIESFAAPVCKAWLAMVLDFGFVDLPATRFEKFDSGCSFAGRGWSWVDPLKEVNALKEGRAQGVVSLTQVSDEQGTDVETTLDQIQAENQMMTERGIVIPQNVGNIAPAKDNADAA